MVRGNVTKSHDTYIECLEALKTEQAYLTNRIISVMRLEVKKRDELQAELYKVYEVDK